MNKKKWNKLEAKYQEVITKITQNPFSHTGGLNNKTYKEMIEELKGKGVTLHELDPATQEKWFASYQQVTRDWVAAQKDPAKAEEVVRLLAKIVEKHCSDAVAVPPEWK